MQPQIWVIAGPNGSGKTTFTRRHLAHRLPVVNPDEIARDLSPSRPDAPGIALRSGREALILREQFISSRESFAIETTFSGKREIELMHEAKAAGYKTNLVFIATASPLASAGRVALRVLDGGHFVPRDAIERRYHRSLENLAKGVTLADRAWLIDNSGKRPRLVATLEHGREKASSMNLPKWVQAAKIPALEQGMGLGY